MGQTPQLRAHEIEQSLRKSEERFRRVVEFAPNAMVMIGPSGTIEMINVQAERLFGYDRGEILGQPVEVLIPERFRLNHPQLRDLFFKLPESRPMGEGRDLFGLRKDGSEFPIEIGLNPIETDDGIMVLSAVVDISARKNLEDHYRRVAESLKASEERFRLVVESTPSGMVMIDQAGNIEMVNLQAERMFGYNRAELAGKPIETLVPTRYKANHPTLRASFFADPEPRLMGAGRDLYGLRKDGSEFPIEIGLNPLETAQGTKVLSAIVDITARKALEQHAFEVTETLRLSEERFRSIFSAIAEGIIITDVETQTFADVNAPGAAMYGYTVNEMIGMTIKDISSGVPPYTVAGAYVWIERAAKTGEVQQFDWHAKKKNGSLFWVEVAIRFAVIGGRKVVMAIARDVTDRRAMEAQLRQALKMEAIGTLAGGVAHELNNLLQPIIMMTELVIADMPDRPAEIEHLNRVVDAGMKASDIVQRILAFGRADEGSHSMLDLGLVVREGISFIRTIMPASITVQVDIDNFSGWVRGDKTQLTQVLINLATNARDAIGPMVGKLTVALSRTMFEAPGSHDVKRRPGALLVVEDTGSGMDRETAARIFEPFFTTKGVGKGTGLGLSVTHGIITGHGGSIQVDSELGRGTRFSIYLPLEEPPP